MASLVICTVPAVVPALFHNAAPAEFWRRDVSPVHGPLHSLLIVSNHPPAELRDRFEEADHAFFERVAQGFMAVAESEPNRVRLIDANGTVDDVRKEIWGRIQHLLARR